MKRILVVDGDTGVRARIAKHARMEGYDVTEAGDGETALSLSRQQNAFDLMVLAVNLPGMDGFTVLKAVRTFSAIPVLILSSKNTAEDRIHGLELGADDYMTKPFSARELLLRISAILKRCSTLASEEAEVLRSGGLVLDLTARRVEVDGRNEKIGKKIREATLEKIPYMLVVGDRDMENQTVSVRLRTGEDLGAMSVADFAARLKQDVDTKAIW